jgi:hypothetical protein
MVILSLVSLLVGLAFGVKLGVHWALDRGLAAAERLQVGDRWMRELATRHHAER